MTRYTLDVFCFLAPRESTAYCGGAERQGAVRRFRKNRALSSKRFPAPSEKNSGGEQVFFFHRRFFVFAGASRAFASLAFTRASSVGFGFWVFAFVFL
jgi:hypothetical protein